MLKATFLKTFVFFFVLFPVYLYSADFYWVGNGGNWSDFANHWQDDQGNFYNRLPGENDDVFFDANSFSLNGQAVTIDVPIAMAKNLNFTGITNIPNFVGNNTDTLAIYGDLRFGNLNNNFNGLIDFRGSGNDSIFTNGIAINGDVRYSGFGKLYLGDALFVNGNFYLQSGEFNTNGENFEVDALFSDNSQTRTFRAGTSQITINGSGDVWKINEINFTISVDSCFISLDHNTNAEVLFNPGGSLVDYNSLTLNTPNVYFNNVGNFGQLTINAGVRVKFKAGEIYNVTNLFAAGNCGNQIRIQSDESGTQAFVNQAAGTISGEYLKIKDINSGGGATFNAINSIDEGNVLGWNITEPAGPAELYWIGGTGDWNDGTNWSTTSNGGSANCIPGPNTNVFFDGSSFQNNGDSVIIDYNAYCNNMDWSTATLNPVLAGDTSHIIQINGDLEMIAVMSAPFMGEYQFKSTGTKSINTNNLPLNAPVIFSANGIWNIASDFTSNSYVLLEEGTLNSGGNALMINAFYSGVPNTRTINFSNSVIDITGDSIGWNIDPTSLTSDFTGSRIKLVHPQISPVQFNGGGLQYNQLMLNTRLTTLNGSNQFVLISIDPGNTLTLEANSTTETDSLSATGNCSEQITIETLTPVAPTATLSKTGYDSLQVDFCIINNVEADTTGARFYGATNSTLLYSTTGWTGDTLGTGTKYYWIDGTGNWDDPTHWSLNSGGSPAACIPSIADTVIFDVNSGDPASVTVRQDAFCAFMDWTTVGGNPELVLFRNLYTRQGGVLNASMKVNAGNTANAFSSKLAFIPDSTNAYFDPDGVDINTFLYFDASKLTDTLFLLNDLVMDTNFAGIIFLEGTFQSNGNEIKSGRFLLETNADKLAHIENSNIFLAAGWDAQNTGGNLSVSADGSTIEVLGTISPSFFYGGDADYYNLILNDQVDDTLFLSGSNAFNRVEINAGVFLKAQSNTIQTVADSIIAIGTCFDSITMIASTPGDFFSFAQAGSKFRGECLNIKDCLAAGAVNFPTLFSTDLGGNTGWDFLADKTSDPAFTVPSFDFCPGDTVFFTNTSTAFDGNVNGLDFKWDFDDGDSTTVFEPNHVYESGGVFEIELSSTFNNGCTETFIDSIRVNDLSLNLGTSSPLTICEGTEVTVNISDQATQYRFFNNSTIVKPFSADTFYTTTNLADGDSIKAEYTFNGCDFEANPILVFSVNPAPDVLLNSSDLDNIICDGETVVFDADGADNYQFFIDNNTVGFFGPDSVISISNLVDGETVSVRGRTDSSSCQAFSDSTYTFTVNANPVVTLTSSAVPQIICDGDLIIFTATGANSYEYFVNGQLAYGPTADDTYETDSLQNGDEVYVIGSINDCPTQSNSFTFLVNPAPAVSLTNTSTNNEICEGVQITFTASGATAYQFFIDGNPATTFSGNNIFSTSALNDGEIVTVVGETNSCQSTSDGDTMSVFPRPQLTFSMNSPDTVICLNEEIVFSASGADQYEWQVNSNTVFGPDPVDTFAFTGIQDGDRIRVRGISSNGCTSTSDTAFAFSVLPIPNVNLYSTSLDSIILKCEEVEFTAIGADSFQFFIDGVAQGPLSLVNTFTTSTLNDGEVVSVIGKNTNCPAPANQEFPMTVNPLPSLTLNSTVPNDTVCLGEGVNLSIAGAADEFEYFINGLAQGASTNRNLSISNLQDGDRVYAAGYTFNCPEYTDTIEFTVLPLPQVSLASSAVPDNTICGGDTVVVTASGAQLYEFLLGGISTGAPSPVDTFAISTLNNNQTISAIGYSFGCAANADTTFTYTVTSIPNVNFYSSNINNIICEGEAIEFTALGSPEYEFFIDGVSQGPSSPTNKFKPTFLNADTLLVTVTATNNNCSSSSIDSFDVVVKPLPEVELFSSDSDHIICRGDSVAFTAQGSDRYRFFIDGIAQGPFSIDSVFSSTQLLDGQTVSVRGDLNGCLAFSDSAYTYTVNPIPNVLLNSSVLGNNICVGDTLTFTANGADEYEFFVNGNSVKGPSADNVFAADTFTTGAIVSVVGSSNNCFSPIVQSTNAITVNSNPTVGLSVSDTTICQGDIVTLTATGANVYQFFANGNPLSNPSSTNTLQVNSIQDGDTISGIGTLPSGCSSQAPEVFIFTVNPYPSVDLQSSISTEICTGTPVDFTASSADTYTFLVNGSPVLGPGTVDFYSTDSLRNNQTVSVIGEQNGCSATSDSLYNYAVYAYPVVTLQSSETGDSICAGTEVVFRASGAASYQYYLNGVAQTPPTPVDTFAISNLQTGDVFALEGINNICRSSAADSFEYTVIDYPLANMTASSGGNPICFGDTITFTGSNAEFYRFYVNEIPQGPITSNNSISIVELEDGDWVRLEAANFNCAVFSADSFQMDVNKMNLTLSSSLTTNVACADESVTFTANGADEYQFFVDGISQGAASANNTLTLNNLQEGQTVNVRGTSFGTGCTMDSEFPFQVSVLNKPEISVLGSSTICDRDTVVLQSNYPENNQWYLNGNLIPGATDPEYKAFEAGDYTLESFQGGNGNYAAVGGNNFGQLGNGNQVNSLKVLSAEQPDSLVQIVAGLEFNIALRSNGRVYTWGANDFGQLGNSNFADQSNPVQLGVLFPSIKIAAGYKHALAITDNGQVYAWGRNTNGQLGIGNTTTSNLPIPVDTFTNIVDIAAGENHSLYLRSNGTVWAWGDNVFGQLGNGTFSDSNIPVQVAGLPANILSIAAGANHSMALAADSTLWVWGNNAQGQLGKSNIAFSSVPLDVNLKEIVKMDGGVAHTLALRTDGRVYVFGGNAFGQLGIGVTGSSYSSPQRLSLKGVKEIVSGPYSSFAIKQDKSIWGWGLNTFGQLGDSTTINKNEPEFLSKFSGASSIAAGEDHTALIYGFSKSCISDIQNINVENNPEAEVINTWPTLSANGGDSYQWYIDGIEISGATDQVLDNRVDGVYTVEVTYANGCSDISEGYEFVTGIDIDAIDASVKIIPNPNEGQFDISLETGNLEMPKIVELLNINGKSIARFGRNSWNTNGILRINASNQPAGLYFVKIIIEDEVLIKKVIVNH